jgi:hypothetical protein
MAPMQLQTKMMAEDTSSSMLKEGRQQKIGHAVDDDASDGDYTWYSDTDDSSSDYDGSSSCCSSSLDDDEMEKLNELKQKAAGLMAGGSKGTTATPVSMFLSLEVVQKLCASGSEKNLLIHVPQDGAAAAARAGIRADTGNKIKAQLLLPGSSSKGGLGRTMDAGESKEAPLRTQSCHTALSNNHNSLRSKMVYVVQSESATVKRSDEQHLRSPKEVLADMLKEQNRPYEPVSALAYPASYFVPGNVAEYSLELMTAVRNGDLETVKKVHAAGHDLQCANRFGTCDFVVFRTTTTTPQRLVVLLQLSLTTHPLFRKSNR